MERTVADRLEAYLLEHPGAADTLGGICEWWLSDVPPRLVAAALDDLVRRGVVRRQLVPGGEAVYSRAAGPDARGPGSHDT